MTMRLEKKLLQEKQYKDAQGYRNRLALFEFAVKKFNLWQWTAEHYDFSNVKKILEVGSGTGDFWKHVYSENTVFESIYVTDFSVGMLDTARETLRGSSLLDKMRFEIADVEDLAYPANSFDAVLAHLMLYHPKSQQRALEEIVRVLQPHGWVGITTFTQRIQREIFSLANKIDARFPAHPVTIVPFDDRVADELLPQFFSNIEKHQEEILVRVPNAEVIVNLIRTHPVTQTLELTEKFFISFQTEVEAIIKRNGTFDTAYTPVLYICREPLQKGI